MSILQSFTELPPFGEVTLINKEGSVEMSDRCIQKVCKIAKPSGLREYERELNEFYKEKRGGFPNLPSIPQYSRTGIGFELDFMASPIQHRLVKDSFKSLILLKQNWGFISQFGEEVHQRVDWCNPYLLVNSDWQQGEEFKVCHRGWSATVNHKSEFYLSSHPEKITFVNGEWLLLGVGQIIAKLRVEGEDILLSMHDK